VDHDFREWAGALDWIVQNIFKLPPLLDGHREQQNRVSSRGITFLFDVCKAVSDSGHCDEPLKASMIASILMDKRVVPKGCEDTADIGDWSKEVGRKLGRLFNDEGSQTLYVDDFRLTRTVEEYDKERKENRATKYYTVNQMVTEFDPISGGTRRYWRTT
jgi:hypothetical protein